MDATGDSTNLAPSFTDDEKKHPPPTMRQSTRRPPPIPTPPFLNKFATTNNDKYTQSLRRDLLLSNFDRNLTVEQAHFDATPSLGVPQDNYTVTGNPGGSSNPNVSPNGTINENNNSNNMMNNNISNNNTEGNYSHMNNGLSDDNHYYTNTNNGNNIYPPSNGYSGGSHSPPLGPMLTPPAESNHISRRTSSTKLDAKRKQTKRTPMHSTATPSEYFHRNLVDAVSNVEDSDENEYYVYPYSGGEHNGNTSDHYRPSAPRSLRSKKSNPGPQLLRSSLSTHDLKQTKPHRPKLRNYVMDPHSSKKDYAATRYQNSGPWRSPRRNQSRRYLPAYQQSTDGYASDDEGESLLWNEDTHKHSGHRCPTLWTLFASISVFCLLCFMLLLYCGTKPLQDVTISMGHVLASDKELIFDLHVTAYNPNGWTVHVAEGDISVFAFSRLDALLVPESDARRNQTTLESFYSGADPAEYLGSFYHFDEPLAFSSSIFSSQPSQAVSQIRIKSPGDDQGGNERWSRIIRYSYGLLARGVLSYHPLRLPGVHSQTVAICNVAEVDPTTGIVSGDPDQGYCAITN